MSELTSRQMDAIVSAYQEGSSLNDLARRYGLDPTQIRRLLLGRGVAMRPRGRQVCTVVDTVAQTFLRDAWLAGHSAGHIAGALDCSETTVRRRARELGLTESGKRCLSVARLLEHA